MDLAGVPGMTEEWRAALERVDVRTTAHLARASDAADVASRAGIPRDRFEGLREAARVRVLAAFREAGVTNERALVEWGAGDLASKCGITQEDVEWFQAAARESLAGLPPSRVTLKPGLQTARVRIEGDAFEAVPVRTAREAAPLFSTLEGDLVVLAPGEALATARVRGASFEALPVYAEGDAGEVPVRVAAVRVGEEAPVRKKKGFFGRG